MDSKPTKKMFLYNITTNESLLLMDKSVLYKITGLAKERVKRAFFKPNKVYRFESNGCEYVAYNIDEYISEDYTKILNRT
jgi:hypothetical protein